jgi:putative acetyltransferase
MAAVVTPERPDHPDAQALIEELEGVLAPLYPATSRHGFSVSRLIDEGVAFFVARVHGDPAGCGGVLLVPAGPGPDEPAYGEVKRMYVRPAFRGQGVARAVLDVLAGHARAAGAGLLRLETGIHQADAIRMYEAWGFRPIGAFGPYRDDPLSRFYEVRLD